MDEVVLFRSLTLASIHLAAAVSVTVHVALHKRSVPSAIGWIGLSWLAPLFGSFLYLLLGINRVNRAGANLGLSTRAIARDRLSSKLDEAAHSGFRGMNLLAETVTRRPLLAGNTVEPLIDGDGAYPAMIAAIHGASVSVTMSSYIFDCDSAGRLFLEALAAAGGRGVEVRVLIDALGARYSKVDMIKALRRAGVASAVFLPTRGKHFIRYANLRDHRKIMVVDGLTGFTGGMNIAEGNLVSRNPENPIQDLHFRVTGPIVTELQSDFAMDWSFSTGGELSGPVWFANPPEDGPVFARSIPDGPDSTMDNMQIIMLGALAAAQYRARIVTPYFLPDEALTAALKTAALRGVTVDIVLPGKSNLVFMDWAMGPQLADLIDRGCRVFLSPPPFDHTKIFTVDGIWSLIGSTNWDPRSLRLNFEYNLECYDPALARGLEELADKRIAAGHALTAKELRSMPAPVRIRNGLARLFSPYL